MSIDTLGGRILGLEPVSVYKDSLKITIDPRIELLSIVQFLSSYDSKYHLLTKHDFEYKKQIKDRFTLYRGHEAIEIFDSLSSGNCLKNSSCFAYDAPPATMLYINDNFSMSDNFFRKGYLINKAGGEKALLSFIQSLHDFALISRFCDFYRSNLPFYWQIIYATIQKIDFGYYIERLESFYGVKQKEYIITLAPLFHCGGFGTSMESIGGTRYVYSIIGPMKVNNDLPDFGSKSIFISLQQHEFSHSFVNPLTDKYWDEAKKYSSIYILLDNEILKQSYCNWRSVLNEHIIRAVTTRFAYERSLEEGNNALELEKSRGFKYVDVLLSKINDYENKRSIYPSFDSFYLELLSVFKAHTS